MKLTDATQALSDSESPSHSRNDSPRPAATEAKTVSPPSYTAQRVLQFPPVDPPEDDPVPKPYYHGDDPVYKALKGYSLFNKETKLEAIVDFLNLPSFALTFTAGDPIVDTHVELLCDPPKLILKNCKSDQKLPSAWCSKWSAEFIIRVVKLIEEDMALTKTVTSGGTRKSCRTAKKASTTLPAATSRLVDMIKQARLKVQNKKMSNSRK